MASYDVVPGDTARFETGRVERVVRVPMQYPCLVFSGEVMRSSIEALRRIVPQDHMGDRVWIYYEGGGTLLCLGGVLSSQVSMVFTLFRNLDAYGYIEEGGVRLEGDYLYVLA